MDTTTIEQSKIDYDPDNYKKGRESTVDSTDLKNNEQCNLKKRISRQQYRKMYRKQREQEASFVEPIIRKK